MMAWPLLLCFGLSLLVALAMLVAWLGGRGQKPRLRACPACGVEQAGLRSFAGGYVGVSGCPNARAGVASSPGCLFRLTETHMHFSDASLDLSQEAGRKLLALPPDAAEAVVKQISLFGRPPTTRAQAEAVILGAPG